MAERKTTKTSEKTAEVKKTTTRRCAAQKSAIALNAENVGFKAGDVYQALAAAGKAMTIKEISQAANIAEEETLLGAGWLFKEGKIISLENKITLA